MRSNIFDCVKYLLITMNRKIITVLLVALSMHTIAQELTPIDVSLQSFYSGLSSPVGMYHCGDNRLFVLEQNQSDIEIINTSGEYIGKFLDLTGLTSTGSERGLLGLAFHPNYQQNGYFYVNYTNTAGNTVIARYQVSENENLANPNSGSILMTINQPYSNHNGGHIAFGPDGYLYIGMGDGGSGGDPLNNAQNKLSLLGKMLRIDVDAGSLYAIPASNPYVGDSNYLPEIWAMGLRNPWKFSFDRLTGDMWIGDVGQNAVEEINLESAPSNGGYNWGWRCYEGNSSYNSSGCLGAGNYTSPIKTYTHSGDNFVSITGGFVHRGSQQPALNGIYFLADYGNTNLYALTPTQSGGYNSSALATTGGAVSAFGEDYQGELYVVRHTGSILKIMDDCPFYPNLTASEDGGLTASSGTQYWWFKDDELIPGANEANYLPTVSGVYYARVSNGECTRQTNSMEWVVVGGIAGCTYPSATNYNPQASVDDGSCVFDNCACPADLDHDGVIGVGDLLIFLGQYGSNCD